MPFNTALRHYFITYYKTKIMTITVKFNQRPIFLVFKIILFSLKYLKYSNGGKKNFNNLKFKYGLNGTLNFNTVLIHSNPFGNKVK